MAKRKAEETADTSDVKKKRSQASSSNAASSAVGESDTHLLPCETGDIAAAFELLGQSMTILSEQLRKTGSTQVVQKHVWQPIAENEDAAPLLLDSFMTGVSALLALCIKEIGGEHEKKTVNQVQLANSMMENLVNFMPVID